MADSPTLQPTLKISPPRMTPSPRKYSPFQSPPSRVSTNQSYRSCRTKCSTKRTISMPYPTYNDDRFIPSRNDMNIGFCQREMTCPTNMDKKHGIPYCLQRKYELYFLESTCGISPSSLNYEGTHLNNILPIRSQSVFKNTIRSTTSPECFNSNPLYSYEIDMSFAKYFRTCPQLMSWNKDNQLAVVNGKNNDIHFLDFKTQNPERRYFRDEWETFDTNNSAIEWCRNPGKEHLLAYGNKYGDVHVYDVNREEDVCVIFSEENSMGHRDFARILSIDFGDRLISAASDGLIVQNDLRVPKYTVQSVQAPNKSKLISMKWNNDYSACATAHYKDGINIWDPSKMSKGDDPRVTLEHNCNAARLDWNPSQRHCLASGGCFVEKYEKQIKIWDTIHGREQASISTAEDVMSLLWNKRGNQICSSHAYLASREVKHKYEQNEFKVWNYNGGALSSRMTLNKEMPMVTNLTASPVDENIVASLSLGGNWLEMWNIFNDTSHWEETQEDHHRSGSNANWMLGDFQLEATPVIR